MDYTTLKARHREEREDWPQSLSLRVHRALSWLDRAERCEDADGRFIFLWIAFNAAYAQEITALTMGTEQARFNRFLTKLVDLDREKALYAMLWDTFSGTVRVLLDNRYVFQPFWDHHNGKGDAEDWQEQMEKAKTAANRALARGDAVTVLDIALMRLYTLRNQLVHGGATWNSRINRDQMRDCSALLGTLVPTIVTLMMDNPQTLWGDACYPVVDA